MLLSIWFGKMFRGPMKSADGAERTAAQRGSTLVLLSFGLAFLL